MSLWACSRCCAHTLVPNVKMVAALARLGGEEGRRREGGGREGEGFRVDLSLTVSCDACLSAAHPLPSAQTFIDPKDRLSRTLTTFLQVRSRVKLSMEIWREWLLTFTQLPCRTATGDTP